MSIDVGAVCAEWERLGGAVGLDGDGDTALYSEPPNPHRDSLVAVLTGSAVGYWPGPGHVDVVDEVDDIAGELPDLARAWGLTPPEPEVIPWEEAEVLWVEWGGTRYKRTGGVYAYLVGPGAIRPTVVNQEARTILSYGGGEYDEVTLTRDTLEDMAEACGLPRTPGAEGFLSGIVRRLEREQTAKAARKERASPPVLREAMEAEPVDQWAEQHVEYDARMDAFCGVG